MARSCFRAAPLPLGRFDRGRPDLLKTFQPPLTGLRTTYFPFFPFAAFPFPFFLFGGLAGAIAIGIPGIMCGFPGGPCCGIRCSPYGSVSRMRRVPLGQGTTAFSDVATASV